MGLAILSRPDTVAGITKSKWVASRNPVLYRMRRQDSGFNQVNNNAGNAQFQFNGVDITAYFQVGNTVRMFSDAQIYLGTATITASSFSAGNTLVTVNVAFAGSDTGYLNNASKRSDWRINIYVYEGLASVDLTPGISFPYYPGTDHETIVDISEIIRQFVSADWNYNGSSGSWGETTTSIKFFIKYEEFFDGAVQGGLQSDVANQFFAVHGAMQLYYMNQKYNHGGNLLSYVPNDSGRSWMTRKYVNSVLHKVRVWFGWPYSLSHIVTATITTQVYIVYRWLDINKQYMNQFAEQIVGAAETVRRISLGLAVPNSIPRVENGEIGLYTSSINYTANSPAQAGGTTYTLDIPLGAMNPAGNYLFGGQVTVVRLSAPVGSTMSLQIFARDSTGAVNVATIASPLPVGDATPLINSFLHGLGNIAIPAQFDTIRIVASRSGAAGNTYGLNTASVGLINTQRTVLLPFKVEHDIPDNSVMLIWKNSIGGDEQHLFGISQELAYKYESGKVAKRLILIAHDISLVEWEAINELNNTKEVYKNSLIELSYDVKKTSTQIDQQVYLWNNESGEDLGVIVIPRANRTETKRVKHSIEIEIELPEVL
jgi:hypothetical protein